MSVFDKAFRLTIGHEGGYVFDKDDKGGETKFGISKRSYPKEDIKNLTIERAKKIYLKDFWLKQKCDQIVNMGSPAIAVELFDSSVNFGFHRAGKFLQEGLNLSNRNEKDFPDIYVDGSIGPRTIGVLFKCRNRALLFKFMNILQGEKYINLMRKNPVYEKYVGWLNRVELKSSFPI